VSASSVSKMTACPAAVVRVCAVACWAISSGGVSLFCVLTVRAGELHG
jgi:hypothetical protein